MEDLVTVATFTFPHEMLILRAQLESEGIECFTKDELMAQINNFNSQAIGGVKLQIRNVDVEKAMPILIDGGYYKKEDDAPNPFVQKLDKFTGGIPFFKNLSIEMRILILVLFIVGAFTVGIYFLVRQ
jgi:hypothetical protein